MKNIFLYLFLILTFAGCGTQQKSGSDHKVLLISFDGFRYDYLSKTDTPNFDAFIASGVASESLIPVFPTMTFPNHYSIATGLYAESHGIINNTMRDPEFVASYSLGDREAVENARWYSGEPIWNTVEKQGKTAGTMFWIGSEAPIQDMRPTHWKGYDGSVPNMARIDTLVKWMTMEGEEQIDFGTLYFDLVDKAGHRYGPESPEVVEAIQEADKLLGYLLNELATRSLREEVNILIVSDHGMVPLSSERLILIDEYIDLSELEVITYSALMMADIKDKSRSNAIIEKLNANDEHFTAYLKEDLPERYHIKNNRRTTDLVVVADEGYIISNSEYASRRDDYPSGGTHGFDPSVKNVQGIFYASGPDLKEGFKFGSIENVHIYELMTTLMDLEPAPNDGSLDSISVVVR